MKSRDSDAFNPYEVNEVDPHPHRHLHSLAVTPKSNTPSALPNPPIFTDSTQLQGEEAPLNSGCEKDEIELFKLKRLCLADEQVPSLPASNCPRLGQHIGLGVSGSLFWSCDRTRQPLPLNSEGSNHSSFARQHTTAQTYGFASHVPGQKPLLKSDFQVWDADMRSATLGDLGIGSQSWSALDCTHSFSKGYQFNPFGNDPNLFQSRKSVQPSTASPGTKPKQLQQYVPIGTESCVQLKSRLGSSSTTPALLGAENINCTVSVGALKGCLDAASHESTLVTRLQKQQGWKPTSSHKRPLFPVDIPVRTFTTIADQANKWKSLGYPEGPSPKNRKRELYKTEMCRNWEEKGFCGYGSRCQFAHGENELRPVKRDPRWKTRPCKTFMQNGSCPYAKRCCFLHDRGAGSVPLTSTSNARSSLLERVGIMPDSHKPV